MNVNQIIHSIKGNSRRHVIFYIKSSVESNNSLTPPYTISRLEKVVIPKNSVCVSIICIVEDALDLLAIERSGKYKGIYHVLHGIIDPLNSIGPDDIYIPQLISRIRNKVLGIREIILATNPTMEGEATALYIQKELTNGSNSQNGSNGLKITRIGRGLPIGADLEYADEVTIERALEGRREY